MGKQTSKNYKLVEYFAWSKKPYNFQNMGNVDFHITGKVWENTSIRKIIGFLNNSLEAEIYTISKRWENWIPNSTGKL